MKWYSINMRLSKFVEFGLVGDEYRVAITLCYTEYIVMGPKA